jgi:hypothetical protein
MLFSIIVIVFIGIIAYWHYLQGFFSAAISAVLAIISALIALGYHEQLVGLVAGKLNDQATAISLVCLFAITYLVLRVLFDAAIPGNVRFPVMLDRIGAPIMGIFAGIFAVGVLAIAAQTLPFGPSIAGYQRYPVNFDKPLIIYMKGKQSDADAVYDEIDGEKFLNDEASGLWVGVDDIVLNVMKKVSAEDGPLSRGVSFGAVHPDFLQELYGQRTGLQAAASRTVNPGKTSVQSVHILGPVMQVDPERWNIGGSNVGVRGKGANPPPPPLDPQRTPAEGKVHLVVRTHFSREDADKKTSMIPLSAANVRLVAKSTESSPPRFKNYFPIGTLEGGRILYINAPDDYMFVPGDKSADFVFEVDEDGVFTAADSSDKSAPRRIAPGVFLEVKRLARVSLAGMTAQRNIDMNEGVEVVRKEGAPPNAIVSGATGSANSTAAKAAPVVVESDAVVSTKLFTPLNVGTTNENERNGLTAWGSFSLQGKKFSKLEVTPSQTIALMSRGDNLVSEFAVPPENTMIQVPCRIAQNHGKWEWADSLADLRLVDSAGKRYTPSGAMAKVVNNQGQQMLAGNYDLSKSAVSISGSDEFRPIDIMLIYLVPKGVELKSFDFKEESLRPVNIKAQ